MLTIHTPAKKKENKTSCGNSPYSNHARINIRHEFLRMLMKHFPPYHYLLKICNKNNVQVSYSCMPNMASIISGHYKTFLDNRAKSNYTIPLCNCRNKASYPLEEWCCQSSIIYNEAITSESAARHYYGCSKMGLKPASTTITKALNIITKVTTELSKAIW